ncbi:MAG TPA: SpoIID/LytB domain-containing protein [Spirochaetia bacterium]|nr:SpoIID/LytB domain-containing protein [Spirochaetia bacterium]
MKWRYLIIVAIAFGFFAGLVSAETDCGEDTGCIQKQIDELTVLLNTNKGEASKIQAKLKSIQSQINVATTKLKLTEANIKDRSEKVSTQYLVLSVKIREMYMRLRSQPLWISLFSTMNMGEVRRELAYRQDSNETDKQVIVSLVSEIGNLESDKKKLEEQKTQLAKLQADLDKQNASFQATIKDLSSKIAVLSAKQQAIIDARSGSFITGVGSVPIGSDYDASIAGFNAGAPSGSFGVFSFGAYTHRKGMSQYGAKARAESQDFESILEAYYGKRPVNKDTGGDIIVNGNSMNFEDKYLMGIAEMPSDWPEAALKAQAVAARTYAYRYKQEGKSICTTESCQVYSETKANNPPEQWKKAVNDTRGKILEDVVTYYSSTTGGYLSTSGWDTTDKSAGGDWTTKAWESKAGSPWFYKAWYRSGYKNSDNSCGRKPWLSEEEMADIINSWLVLKQGEGSGVDTGRIVPVTISSCKVGGQSGEPYSMSELRSKLSNPVTSISGKPVLTNDGSGNTTNVRFSTNRGEINISGLQFKEVFNTRAPGYISIPQKGFAFFNIERK